MVREVSFFVKVNLNTNRLQGLMASTPMGDLQSFFQQFLTQEYVYKQTQSKRVKRLAALPYWVSSRHFSYR